MMPRQNLDAPAKRRVRTSIFIFVFWIGVLLVAIGLTISFFPGAEVLWFAATSIMCALGLFVPGGKYKIGAALTSAICVFFAYDGYVRRIDYLELLRKQDQSTVPDTAKRYAQIEQLIANFDGNLYEYRNFYRRLFSIADLDLLPRLKRHENASIALQAAWESVERSVPDEIVETTVTLDQGQLKSFLDFVINRFDAPVPDWWQYLLLNSRAKRRLNSSFFENGIKPFYRNTEIKLVQCPVNATLEKQTTGIVYRVKDDSFLIPNEVVQRGQLFNLSGSFTPDHFFFTAHGDAGHPHTVFCVNRETRDVMWESVAFGCYMGMTSGLHYSWVELVPTDDDRLFVFGFACTGMYLQAFNSETGESLFHFSTGY